MLDVPQHDGELIARIVPSGGEMGRRMRELDWSNVAVGRPSTWSPSFRSALSICLGSRFPIALYWGDDLTLIYNDAWSPILGTKHPQALGNAARVVWPEIWDAIGPLFSTVLATGESSYQEDGLLLMNRHGYTEECYFNFTFTPVRGDDGRIEGVFNAVNETTFRVISERRASVLRNLAEHAISDRSVDDVAERVVKTLGAARFDATFSVIYLADESGGLRRVGWTGLDDAEAIAPAYIAAEHVAESRWRFGDVRRSGKVEIVDRLDELPVPLSGGAWPEPTRSAMVAPIRSTAAPDSWGFLIIGASPRRAVDREYEEFAERAAATVTRVVANALTLEAERRRADELAELDRAKTAFFSNISHEFRTPLTLMLGPQQDALESPANSLGGADLQAVHRNTLRLLKLVNSLLDFARVQAGRATAAYEPVDLAALTSDLASAFRSAIERGGIRFEVDCPSLQEPIFVDREMWEKIVLNLLSNALKFTFEGSIRISQRIVGDHVEVEVEDSGVGIPEHEMPRLFERFHRIEGTKARTHEGSGIGLALVHDLVQLHGGTIVASSVPDKGTTFRITLPRGSAHLPASHIKANVRAHDMESTAKPFVVEALRWVDPSASAPRPVAANSTTHVLIADDNADMREYLARLLGQHWSVDAVADGALALAAVRRRRPDLVITDLMMPNMDGVSLLHALRADQATRDLPVIALSARAGEEARVEGLRAGFDDYVVKPFSARELVVRVETQLAKMQVRAVTELHNRRLANVFANTPVGIAILRGPEHRFEFVNASYAALVHDRSVLGKTIREAFPDLAGQGSYELLDAVYTSGEPQSVRSREIVLVRQTDGVAERRFFDTVYQPLRDEAGAVDGIVVVVFEVTELARARRLAESANRAKDEFMAILGHELRNPLAPILTAVHLMQLRGDTSLEKERSVIERQANHLVRLVDDLLDVSRITTGKVELKKQPIEVGEVIAKALEMASSMLEQRKQQLTLDVPSRGLVVNGDPTRLAQVFSNLLTNAAKYTEPGGVITVTAARQDARIVIRIRDTGIGISAEMLPRVFELFTQERQALDRANGGLGLGLSIVKNLVAMHGGLVEASSAGRGCGSEFVVTLPAVNQVSAAVTNASSTNRDAEAQSIRMRVLVVDDNVDAAELLAESLEMMGYTTRTAHDGPSALVVADDFKPEIAVLDIGLPAMDGYELARLLRGQPALAGLRLVAVTGYGQETDRRAAQESGFNAHLVKPVDMDRLRTVLRQVAPTGHA
ncbi:MAG TPA: ATP-binding protein [Kofleriaceae bacterium]|nr:ATP-binding protein [Kofleriaceae bacterium]